MRRRTLALTSVLALATATTVIALGTGLPRTDADPVIPRPAVTGGTAAPTTPPTPRESAPAGTPSPSGTPSIPATPGPPLEGVVVAIDPGHNRDNAAYAESRRPVDAGGFEKECNSTGTAAADGYAESRHTWELALVVAEALRAAGAEVPMTRDRHEGWGPCVDARGRFGAASGADLLLSLHADGSTAAGDTGFHVIRPGLLPGWTDDVVEPSTDLAEALRDALVAHGFTVSTYRGTDGIDVRTDLGTLNWADVPTVLVETHNMRDAGDDARMRTAEARQRFADALVTGVRTFLRDGAV